MKKKKLELASPSLYHINLAFFHYMPHIILDKKKLKMKDIPPTQASKPPLHPCYQNEASNPHLTTSNISTILVELENCEFEFLSLQLMSN